jgi:hypothetical protein
MPSDLETNIRSALEKLSKALADASELTVSTYFKDMSQNQTQDLSNPELAAQTKIELDGDQTAIVPVTRGESGDIVLQNALLDFHLRNVQSAVAYRASILNALLELARGRGI